MNVMHERLWPMLHEIRQYARTTGLRIVSRSPSVERLIGFETDCSEFKAEYRFWYISLTNYKRTRKEFDIFLDGERVLHPQQEEILGRYLELWPEIEGRDIIAEALTTGKHPSPPKQRVAA